MEDEEITTEETVVVAVEETPPNSIENQLEELRAQMASLVVEMEALRNERTISDNRNDRSADESRSDASGGTQEEARPTTERDVRPSARHWFFKKRL